MKRVLPGSVAIVCVLSGACGGGVSPMMGEEPISISFRLTPSSVAVNEDVECFYFIEAPVSIRWVRVDFDDDGVWEYQEFSGYPVAADTFNYRYQVAGQWFGKLEVELSDGRKDFRYRTVNVSP